MRSPTAGRIGGLLFVSLFSVLTALRVWNLQPPIGVQVAIVNAAALLSVLSITYYSFRGGSFVDSWLLVFGPSFAYTLNLLVPLIPIVNVGNVTTVVALALAAGAGIAGVLAVVGYLLGRVFRTSQP
jgi:hypothetical protein